MRCLEISLSNTNFFFANKCLSLKGPNFEIGPTSEKRIFSALQKKIIKIITFHLYCTNTSVLREGTEGGGVRRGSGGDVTEAGRAPLHRAAMRLLRCCAVAACTALCAPGCVEAFALSAPAPHRTGPASWGREPRAAGRPAAGDTAVSVCGYQRDAVTQSQQHSPVQVRASEFPCQFQTEKCQFQTEKCLFQTEKCQDPRTACVAYLQGHACAARS